MNEREKEGMATERSVRVRGRGKEKKGEIKVNVAKCYHLGNLVDEYMRIFGINFAIFL